MDTRRAWRRATPSSCFRSSRPKVVVGCTSCVPRPATTVQGVFIHAAIDTLMQPSRGIDSAEEFERRIPSQLREETQKEDAWCVFHVRLMGWTETRTAACGCVVRVRLEAIRRAPPSVPWVHVQSHVVPDAWLALDPRAPALSVAAVLGCASLHPSSHPPRHQRDERPRWLSGWAWVRLEPRSGLFVDGTRNRVARIVFLIGFG